MKNLLLPFIVIVTVIFCAVPVHADQSTKPVLMIEKYSCDRDVLTAGTDFKFNYTIRNTSGARDVTNVVVSFSFPGNAFYSKYGSSNQQYVNNIKSGGAYDGSMELTVNPLIENGPFNIDITMDYQVSTEAGEASLKTEASLTIFVQNERDIRITEFSMPSLFVESTKTFMSIKYENTDYKEIRNVNILLDGDILDREKTIPVGSMKGGSSSFTDFYVTFLGEGQQMLSVQFSFEDSDNKRHVTAPYEVGTIVERQDAESTSNDWDAGPAGGPQPRIMYLELLLAASVVIILAIIIKIISIIISKKQL